MHKALFLTLVVALGAALPVQAASVGKASKIQSQPLPPSPPQQPQVAPVAPAVSYQAPPTLPNGNPNLIYYWYEYGGARVAWQGQLDPQQVKLLGPAWRDPAAYPQLTGTGRTGGRGHRARGKRATAPAKAAKAEAKAPDNAAQAPKADAGKAQASPKTENRSSHLVPGPKPTTYSEITPKAARPGNTGTAPVTMPVQAAPVVPMTAPVAAPMPTLTPTPLVPASSQPTAATTQAAGSAATNISRQ